MQPTVARTYQFVIETPENDYIVKRPGEDIADAEVSTDVDAIARIPFVHHKLTKAQITTICKRALHAFRTVKPGKKDCSKLNKWGSQLPRSLIFNFNEKYFEILAKKHGKLRIKGDNNTGSKSVTEGIKVHLSAHGKAHVEKIAHLSPMRETSLKADINYEKKYGQLYSVVTQEYKTCYTKKLYDYTLHEFTKDGVKKGAICEIFTICKKVGTTLQKMHHDGVVHRDIKPTNILYSHIKELYDDVALCDFGCSYAPGPRARIPGFSSLCYGTPHYSAPECYAKTKLEDKFRQAAGEDMYALGCTLYEVLFSKAAPWRDLLGSYFANPMSEAVKEHGHQAHLIQLNEHDRLKFYASQTQVPQARILLEMLIGLLEPEPEVRMTIDQFMDKVVKLEQAIQACTMRVVINNTLLYWRFLKPETTATLLTMRRLDTEYEEIVRSIKAFQQQLSNNKIERPPQIEPLLRKMSSEQASALRSPPLPSEALLERS